MPKIVVVVPSCRPQSMASFRVAWDSLFKKHSVTLITVWDGEVPRVEVDDYSKPLNPTGQHEKTIDFVLGDENREYRDLFCRKTDACRNIGFVEAARLKPDYLLTLDDDVAPVDSYDWEDVDGHKFFSKKITNDPIQAHLDALSRRVPLSWMNTAHDTDLYLRGVPYSVRDEAPVMLSHGVWVGTPDFDGETQLKLEESDGKEYIKPDGTRRMGPGVPYSLPYYVGPIPRGVLFPYCGMSIMVRKEAIPYLYYAPQGPDTGIPELNRFGDIWGGVQWKREFDALGWATYSGASTILHTRASDAKKNFDQEKLGREWNEWVTQRSYPIKPEQLESFSLFQSYWASYLNKRERYRQLVQGILDEGNTSKEG